MFLNAPILCVCRASGTEGPQRQPAGEAAASSRTSSAVSLEAILEHAGQSSQGAPQGLPAISNSALEAALPSTPGARADHRGPALHLPLFGVSLDSVSEGMIRRLSSGASSNGELIAALHSPEPAAQPPIDSPRSPLPAPPQHLKVCPDLSTTAIGHVHHGSATRLDGRNLYAPRPSCTSS